MGDVVQGLGAVAALHRARPDWRLTFVTQTAFAPLLDGVAGVHRVVTFERRAGLAALRALRRRLREDRYDTALDLQGNWKSAMVAWLSGARERIGMSAPWRQEPASRLLLHRTVACAAPPHPARAAWELVRTLAPEVPFERPRLVATARELERECAALTGAGIDPARPFAVVVVTDPADPRALRPARVAEIARSSVVPVVFLMGPDEAHVTAPAGVPCVRHAAGDVRRLIALGGVVAGAAGHVVGPDQGAMHVLAAAGAPSRVLFGAQDPRRTAPPAAVALVHPSPPSCSPCRQRRCTHAAGPICMDFPLDGARVADHELPRSS
jgi:ADP-heptose:LPS heptosyltransferase